MYTNFSYVKTDKLYKLCGGYSLGASGLLRFKDTSTISEFTPRASAICAIVSNFFLYAPISLTNSSAAAVANKASIS